LQGIKLESHTKVSPNGLNDNTCCRATWHPHHVSFKKVRHCVINRYCTTYRQQVSAQKADPSCATSLYACKRAKTSKPTSLGILYAHRAELPQALGVGGLGLGGLGLSGLGLGGQAQVRHIQDGPAAGGPRGEDDVVQRPAVRRALARRGLALRGSQAPASPHARFGVLRCTLAP